MPRLSLFFFLLLFGFGAFAQQDSSSSVLRRHSSRTAMIASTLVPGLGQLYNRKYWKLPLIYGGGYFLVSAAIKNGSKYQEFLKAYRYRTDGDPATVDAYPKYSEDNLILIKDVYRRNRDLSIIGLTVVYALNIIDAYVDAELFHFDVSDNLRADIQPVIIQNGPFYSPQVQMVFSLK